MGGRVRKAWRGLLGLVSVAALAQAPASPPPAGSSSAAVGDLLVAPTRLVLEGNQRTAEVTLVNVGERTATYRISLTHLRMDEDGQLIEFEEASPDDHVADALVRFSPRQVTLEPNVAQTVRISVRKPAQLEPGEYRSHMLFRAIPPPEAMQSVEPAASTTGQGLSIRLIPIYGVSIPLIVRHGETAAKASIADVTVTRDETGAARAISLRLNREGNRSVYGNLRAVFIPEGGSERVVGMLGGVAVYTPLDHRNVSIALQPDGAAQLGPGRLRVLYVQDGPGEALIASGETAIP